MTDPPRTSFKNTEQLNCLSNSLEVSVYDFTEITGSYLLCQKTPTWPCLEIKQEKTKLHLNYILFPCV